MHAERYLPVERGVSFLNKHTQKIPEITTMQRWTSRFVVGLTLLVCLTYSAPPKGKLYPVDEASQDASFLEFREKLAEAIKNRDKDYILSILDPDIKNSFGGDGGIEEFKSLWKLDESESELWNELLAVLTLGGAFGEYLGGTSFEAPYVSASWPDEYDAYEYMAIVGENVSVRLEPSLSATVIDALSYDIVKRVYVLCSVLGEIKADGHTWMLIITPDGKAGFVSRKYLRSAIDYRAYFSKTDGKWFMACFIAGD
jgi:hypothetical protein